MARFINEQQPDILCIQEVFKPKQAETLFLDDQFNFLSELKRVGAFEHEYFAPAYGLSIAGKSLEEGQAILSKFPISNQAAPHTYQHYFNRDEIGEKLHNTRIIQHCLVSFPDGKQMTLGNYQGYLDGPKGIGTEVTIETMQKVRDELKDLPRPMIFCGDFNVWPSSPALKELDDLKLRNLTIENGVKSTLSDMHRAPAEDRAIACCDYILVSDEVVVKSFSVSEEIVSDHKALILKFTL